ncbi:siderophore-interacting protein [Microbacterium sp. CIAB417]|uniref:siderophore-interacting protein n=1 Tax=Microbacterium sp. CIAB417 TaxID=2860287 RepID=UPI0027E33158|nr:siderophore-interacting protein [Microbacterium sp. CIAB417]
MRGGTRPRRERARVFAAEVVGAQKLTPRMRRLTIAAPEFADYEPTGPDEYLGLLLPCGDGAPLVLPASDEAQNIRAAVAAIPSTERPDLRWYTLRAHRAEAREIDVDVVVHGDEGPGTRFARRARPGSVLGIREGSALYGPLPRVRARVLIGDETAIPAIARILEQTDAPETQVFVEVADAAEKQELAGPVTWIERAGERPGDRLQHAVRGAELPATIDDAWVCGERLAVQELRRHLIDRGVSKERITFSGYWRLGEARG